MVSFLGLGDFGALNTIHSYTALGITSGIVLWLLGSNTENLIVAVSIGTLGHLEKFLVKSLFGLVSSPIWLKNAESITKEKDTQATKAKS